MNSLQSSLLIGVFLLLPSPALATWELGVYGGLASAHSTDVTQYASSMNESTWTWERADFLKSAAIGGALTYWTRVGLLDWGLQLEAEHFNVNVKNQAGMRAMRQQGVLYQHQVEDLNPSDTDVTTLGLNVLVRWPLPYLQPFLGAGSGAAFADNRPYSYYYEYTAPTEQSDISVSAYWQVLGGVRVPVTEQWGLFAQYKYMSFPTTFHYNGVQVLNQNEVHHAVMGLSVQW